MAFASSLDHPGPFARTVRDSAILLRAMAGHDPKDSTSARVPVPDFEAACARGVKGLRIGVPKEYRSDGMPAEIEALWRQGAPAMTLGGYRATPYAACLAIPAAVWLFYLVATGGAR